MRSKTVNIKSYKLEVTDKPPKWIIAPILQGNREKWNEVKNMEDVKTYYQFSSPPKEPTYLICAKDKTMAKTMEVRLKICDKVFFTVQ
jgi:hypothetical protein